MKTAKHIRPCYMIKNLLVAYALILVTVLLVVLALYSVSLAWQLRESETRVAAATEQVDTTARLVSKYKDAYERTVAESEERYNALEAEYRELESLNATLLDSLAFYQEPFTVDNPAPPRYIDCALDENLQSYIWSLCSNYGIEDKYELIYAVIKCESRFDAAALSQSNDYGLMQINVVNHSTLQSRLGVTDFFDPYQNVHAGIYMLASLLHKYDVPDALMAYNMGEYGAAKLWRRGIHSTAYSDQVLDYYYQFTGDI